MKKNFKILLTTDYSDANMSAERYAVQFALSTHSILSILHVYSVPLGSIPAQALEFAKTSEDFKESEQRTLEQHRIDLFHSLNVHESELSCELVVREGNVGKEICNEAKDWEADFIIVGTHEVGVLKSLFSGTHAWEVIKKSGIPVLAVPPDGLYVKPKTIVFGTEERETEISSLNFVAELAKQFDAEIIVYHIINKNDSIKFDYELFEKFKELIKKKILYTKINFRLEFNHDIVGGLARFAETNNADWLVVSPKNTSVLSKIFTLETSVTKKVSFKTHLPLLSIPDNFEPIVERSPTFLD